MRAWKLAISQLARYAYEAYGDDADWQTFDGRPMPKWDDLDWKTKRHWSAAVHGILSRYFTRGRSKP